MANGAADKPRRAGKPGAVPPGGGPIRRSSVAKSPGARHRSKPLAQQPQAHVERLAPVRLGKRRVARSPERDEGQVFRPNPPRVDARQVAGRQRVPSRIAGLDAAVRVRTAPRRRARIAARVRGSIEPSGNGGPPGSPASRARQSSSRLPTSFTSRASLRPPSPTEPVRTSVAVISNARSSDESGG